MRRRLFPALFCGQQATPWYLSGGISSSNCVAAYSAEGAASLAASYTNLANPGTYDITAGVEPEWDATNGWKGDGSAYLQTGVVPVDNQTWTVLIKFSSVPIGSLATLFGNYTTVGGNARMYVQAYTSRSYASGNKTLSVGSYLLSGVIGIAGAQPYFQGIPELSALAAGTGTNPLELYLLCANLNGAPYQIGSHYIQRFAVYNTTLTATQVWQVTTAMKDLPIRLDTFQFLAPMPAAKDQHGFEACNGKLYAAGGEASKKFYAYDPNANTWATLADLPFAEAEHQSCGFRAVGNKLYFIGGYNSGTSAIVGNVYEYDTEGADAWVEKTAMPTPREDFGTAVLDGKIYCFGGIKAPNPTPTNVLEIYDPATDTWDTTKASMPAVKALGDFGAACNGKIYAVSGTNTMTGYPTLTPVTTVYEYDPIEDAWATKAAAPVGTCYKEVEVIGNNLYVVGGIKAGVNTDPANHSIAIYVYNTLTDSWSQTFNAPYAAGGTALAVLNGKIYMCGGGAYGAIFGALASLNL